MEEIIHEKKLEYYLKSYEPIFAELAIRAKWELLAKYETGE